MSSPANNWWFRLTYNIGKVCLINTASSNVLMKKEIKVT
jgi:hypothetical protein